jgi:hypothetical protein
MKRSIFFLFFAMAMCICAMTSQAQAQATRTWVSGTGDDANPCSRTAPCKTFAGAITKTADCGEIDALDPAGYGAITITKGITIDGGGGEAGQVASILAGSGAPGVVVNNGSANCHRVVLRNLDITGVQVGTIGVNFLQGFSLSIENVDIANFTQQGINVQPLANGNLVVYNSNIENNGGGGLQTSAGSGITRASLDKTRIHRNAFGVNVGANSSVTLRDCLVSLNSGDGVQVNGASANLTLFNDTIDLNIGDGVHSTNGNARLASTSVMMNNGIGLHSDGGGILSFQNNYVVGNNGGDGARTGILNPT